MLQLIVILENLPIDWKLNQHGIRGFEFIVFNLFMVIRDFSKKVIPSICNIVYQIDSNK